MYHRSENCEIVISGLLDARGTSKFFNFKFYSFFENCILKFVNLWQATFPTGSFFYTFFILYTTVTAIAMIVKLALRI